MTEPLATVFGGTGFLGRRVVKRLAEAGYRVRVAARQPDLTKLAAPGDRLQAWELDIRDSHALSPAIACADLVVNAVSLYVEKGSLSFEAIHVEGARKLARACRESGVGQLVHLSGIGAAHDSPSAFIRARACGEDRVREEFPRVTILRPSVMFGPDDAFLGAIELATRSPVVPLFGRGENRLQPVCVLDVAQAIAALAQRRSTALLFELGGAEMLAYRQVVQAVCAHLERRRWLLPLPFALWKAAATGLALLPHPPLTLDQIYLLETDNVASAGIAGFAELDIEPRAVTASLGECLT